MENYESDYIQQDYILFYRKLIFSDLMYHV